METLIGFLPFAIVALACPLMMIFMMRGMHGGHGEQSGHASHAAHGGAPEVGDEQTATRLQAMEEEITEVRRELAERDAEKLGLGRDGRF